MILEQDDETGWWVVSKEKPDYRLTNLHDEGDCGEYCDIHDRRSPWDSHYPLNWRDDRGIMEFICSHGIGHPTHAQVLYQERTGQSDASIHGCCGCC